LFLNGRASRFLTEQTLLAGNVYYRKYKNENFSSNVNDDYDGPSNTACDGTDPDNPCPGINDRSEIDTDGYGAAFQVTFLAPVADRSNSLTLGLSADLGDTAFTQEEQNALFTPDRGTTAVDDFEEETNVKARNAYYGIYFTDTYSLTQRLFLTLSGRYNYATVEIEDQTGLEPELNGDHSFSRFNPAVGLNFNPSPELTTYVSYSEGMRAPTPVELTCADPNAPCRLPNNFLADPPLEKVVSKTIEAGARGKAGEHLGWSLAIYNTDLDNDIQFISAGGAALNAGFFDNVGKTRRRGAELGASYSVGSLRLLGNYSFIRATFESPLTINSPNNTSADGAGDIQVSPGNRIPGIPEHAVKLRAEFDPIEKLTVGGTFNYYSAQYARGDENNQDANGQIPGYSLVHLDGRYQASKRLQIFGRIQNLFDKEYETLGVLGENFFVGGTFDAGTVAEEQFRSVGAPRAAWVGLRYQFTQ